MLTFGANIYIFVMSRFWEKHFVSALYQICHYGDSYVYAILAWGEIGVGEPMGES